MRFASAYEVTTTGRGIKSEIPRSPDELEAFLAMAQAGMMGPAMGMMGGRAQMGQQMPKAIQGGNPGSNIINAFMRKDCQVPFNIPGMGPVDTGQPSGARNNNAAFKAGLHIGAGNKPSLMGGQQGGMMGGNQGRMMGMNQRGGRMMMGGMMGPGGMFMGQGPGGQGPFGFLSKAYQGRQQMQGRSGGMMGGGMLAQGVAQAKGTNCGDMVRQIDVMVMSKSGQYQTIRGLIDSGAGVALMDPKVASSLGFSASDGARTIMAVGEGGTCNACPLINIMVMIPPSTMPLGMQAVIFADGQGDVFTPFPTCDLTMRVNIDIDSAGHTITAQDTGMSMRYDCMGGQMGGMMGGQQRMMGGMQRGMMQGGMRNQNATQGVQNLVRNMMMGM